MNKKRLLIVDDQIGIRILLLEVFANEGYETFQAASGRTALDIVCKKRPHLVLLDMKIPGMDGLEILTHIKAFDKKIKVIIMTAYGELDLLNQVKELGVITHFTKPFDIDELRLTVQKQIGKTIKVQLATGS